MFVSAILVFLIIGPFNQLPIETHVLNKEWDDYKIKYGLKFSIEEDNYRKEIFTKNYRFIIESNSKNSNLILQMNKFGHLEPDEGQRFLNRKKGLRLYEDEEPIYVGTKIPRKYDYRKDGVVTRVIDQYNCGSCYAYSALGAIESQFAIRTGVLTDLSEQEIVDCSRSYGNEGCLGGNPENVYQYCMDVGVTNYRDYRYKGIENVCARKNNSRSYRLRGYRGLTKGDEYNLLRALYHIGPISIVIDHTSPKFKFYKSGIIDIENCTSQIQSHAVLAVGYNLNKTPYLIVKNSFGKNWGICGYFKIALFKNDMCGLASWATYPIPMI